jgi:hypothetical protein
MVKTIESIERLLAEYYNKGAGQHITELLDIQDKLAIHSYRLAEMAANAKNEYNGCYFIRKISVGKNVQGLMNSRKISKAQAQVEADIMSEEDFKAELDAEGEAYKYDMLVGQVNKVLSAIQQRISYLKTEKQNTHA